MTIKIINTKTASKFFGVLEELVSKGHIFRGHRDSKWRLSSTLSRHLRAQYHPSTSWDLDEMIRHFLINLKTIGIDPPYKDDTRRERLELARHHAVPSPLIDFSRSPYIAAFFAFSGVRPYESKRNDRSAIFCVNIFEFG